MVVQDGGLSDINLLYAIKKESVSEMPAVANRPDTQGDVSPARLKAINTLKRTSSIINIHSFLEIVTKYTNFWHLRKRLQVKRKKRSVSGCFSGEDAVVPFGRKRGMVVAKSIATWSNLPFLNAVISGLLPEKRW